ncbi:ferredoxin [Spirochaeta cellobiosiphila]|uniref:ferredoxin n=1 Tax=Spirochaeta cellobiosiphila TaxID=504483 RepID=UPI000A02488B|nr:ferredoxin [Spirochaeta cellobiosiphila]
MIVKINKNLCIGCGICEEMSPDLFEMGDYTADIIKEIEGEEEKAIIHQLIKDCPGSAVIIEED